MDILQYNNKKAVLSTALTQINNLLCFLIVGVVQSEILRVNSLIFNNLQRYKKNHRAKDFFLFFAFFFQVSQDI